jgi:hypothetical protein
MVIYLLNNKDQTIGDVIGSAEVGDPGSPDSWEQMKDPKKGYIGLSYDRKADALRKSVVLDGEIVRSNVMGK